jgi:monoamine oxidase
MDESDGDRSFRLVGGYGGLVRAMEENLNGRLARIRLNAVATDVWWTRNEVLVRAEGRTFVGRKLLVTVPLGVLQRPPAAKGGLHFLPGLPVTMRAAGELRMASVVKLTLRFRERFWDNATSPRPRGEKNLSELQFLMSRDQEMPTWWSTLPIVTPVLVGWAGGPAAERLSAKGASHIVERGLAALGRLLRIKPAKLEKLLVRPYVHDWQADPFSRGAYSFVPVGAMEAQQRLGQPVEGTIFFAGEATLVGGHGGTVHGALRSGRHAAAAMLQSDR